MASLAAAEIKASLCHLKRGHDIFSSYTYAIKKKKLKSLLISVCHYSSRNIRELWG